MITGQAAVVAGIGVFVGLAAAFALTRFMASFLFRVDIHDGTIFGGVSIVLAAAAVLAGRLPARRAASVDPIEALHEE